jgi:hypothetical protein
MKKLPVRVALVALLVGAAVIGRPAGGLWITLGVLTFAIFNVVTAPPGTEWVRASAVGAAFAALLWPGQLLGPVVVFALLVWPLAIMMAWALTYKSGGALRVDSEEAKGASLQARIALAALIGAVAIAALAYRLIVAHGLQQTAALFVGIPSLLAIVVVFAVSPRSATGVACKAVTISLLVSLLFLGEGVLCVVMSAPLFYALAIAIGSTMDAARRRDRTTTSLCSCLILLAVVPMSLEGVTGFTTMDREESVTQSRIVRASSQAVERALFEPPRFDRVRPLYLRAGFPVPVATRIERSVNRTRWVITMRGGEMRLNGIEPRMGDLVLQLEGARPGAVRWRAVSDGSHMTHFLTWREILVEWQPVDAQTTNVTWTLRYRRDLDPSWYFGPAERYAARLAAGYLIDSVATP